MFPRINKFSNLSTTTGATDRTTGSVVKKNDSANMKNILFGGDESTTPSQPKGPSNFYPSASQDLHLVSPLQAQA